ncbi:unnamed protein product (macronuclear) [Paramecium tetraurelia]|uniref:PB1 domain-containing protein n=1 Tax=Paramecium tetraurelia TaxID=5888 RepID=A0E1Q0_PARTE|nr:uncharacterized protein GSPATT00022388001 [Paramecium tetraurelia]CAK89217.1 unnamed protein product [Paramecium tetraurelia]|eukprot:XP_001456614.1 hypothetical protein (macronuclear) [Paramecium tetraurelia strain d4-2]
MIIIVYHNKQKIKIVLAQPSLQLLYKLVQENLKLPYDFELRDKKNKILFDLFDGLETNVVEVPTMNQKIKSKTVNDQQSFRVGRNRIQSLNLQSSQKESNSDFSTQNDLTQNQQNKREQIIQRMMEDKLYREEQQKINSDGNKLIKQIQKRIKLKEQVFKLKDEALNLSELEKKKIILAQRRELSQPIRLDALTEHQKRYEEEKFQKLKQRQQQKQELDEEFKMKLIKFPKSQALVRLEEEQAKLKLSQQQASEQKKLLKQKQLRYGESVKDSFLKDIPRHSISPIKQTQEQNSTQKSQLEIAKQNIKKLQSLLEERKVDKILILPERRSVNDIRQRGQNSLIEIKQNNKIDNIEKPYTTDHKNLISKRKVLKSGLNSANFPSSLHEIKPIYFEEKYQNVLNSIMQLEQKCKEKEKKLILNKSQILEEEENQKFIENLRQKLALI